MINGVIILYNKTKIKVGSYMLKKKKSISLDDKIAN